MRSNILALLAVSAMACLPLPAHVPVTTSQTDALLLEGEWRGEFISQDGQRGGSITFALEVSNDTARGLALLVPITYQPAGLAPSAPVRAQIGTAFRTPMHFVSVTEGVVTGTMAPFFDVERLTVVQMTLVGQMRSWNVIEGTYLALGTDLRTEERGTWRMTRGH